MSIHLRALRILSASSLGIVSSLAASQALAMGPLFPPAPTPTEYCADRDADGFYDPADCTTFYQDASDYYDTATSTLYHKKSDNKIDNCPQDPNDQKDWDQDGVGNVCEYVDVSVGANHACAIRADGSVGCWGDNTFGQTNAPIFKFSAIAVGRNHSCGLLDSSTAAEDGGVLCWGDNRSNQLGAKNDRFVSIRASGDVTCGVTKDGVPRCWGGCGADETCQPDAAVKWATMSPAFDVTPNGSDTSLYGMCGLAAAPASTVTCFNGRPPVQPPEGRFASFEGGDHYGCGITLGSNLLQCWGRSPADPGAPADAMLTPPSGTHSQVSVGLDHACALSSDNTQIHCWGSNESDKSTPPATLSGPFAVISVGDKHSCVRKTNGQVVCWGDTGVTSGSPFAHDGNSKILPVAPIYNEISVKDFVACGLSARGRVSCAHIGRPAYVSPEGKFQSVSVGEGESCGMRQDGQGVCWDGTGSIVNIPASLTTTSRLYTLNDGSYKQREYLCGIFANSRKVYCRDQGQPMPVESDFSFGPKFKEIGVMGQRTVCGITEDERFICQEYGNATEHQIKAGTQFKELSCSTGVCCAHDSADAYCIDSDGTITRSDKNKDRSRSGQITSGIAKGTWVTTDESGYYEFDYHASNGVSGATFTVHLRGTLNPVPGPSSYQLMGRFAMGPTQGCQLFAANGNLRCWSDGGDASGAADSSAFSGMVFTDVGAGESFSCGLTPEGNALCWGQVRPNLALRRDYRGKALTSVPVKSFTGGVIKTTSVLAP